MQAAKNMVSTCPSSCLLIQRTSKHLGHHSSVHVSGEAILSVLSSSPNGQVELKVGQGKEETLLPTGQVHLNRPFATTGHVKWSPLKL